MYLCPKLLWKYSLKVSPILKSKFYFKTFPNSKSFQKLNANRVRNLIITYQFSNYFQHLCQNTLTIRKNILWNSFSKWIWNLELYISEFKSFQNEIQNLKHFFLCSSTPNSLLLWIMHFIHEQKKNIFSLERQYIVSENYLQNLKSIQNENRILDCFRIWNGISKQNSKDIQ